ncbi:MAG: PorV/PorQ family protein [Ignavibacteriaceae bacterium]|nr:PorV/PorQ family protein [Ignavibacteriaceae bacterium]
MILFIPFCLMGQSKDVSKVGTTAAVFLEIPAGAHAVGMGGAFVSQANDASALYWNVGGISTIEKYDLNITNMTWIGDTKYNFIGLVLPLGEFGTLGLSFTSLSMDDMAVTTVEKPEGTGEFFSAGDISFGVSYARNLTDRFSIGFTLKYIQESIWHMTAEGFGIDAGVLFKTDILGRLIIGASISNFGTSMQLDGRDTRYFIRVDEGKQGSNDRIPTNIEMDSWELPLIFRIGVSDNIVQNDIYRFTASLDAIHPNNDYESLNIGGEFAFMEFLMIRGGYNSLFLQDGEGGLSLGIGVNSKMLFSDALIQFDYAFRDFGRLQNVNMFSIEFKF